MPLRVSLTLGDDTFEIEGDFSVNDPAVMTLMRIWLNSIGRLGPTLEDLTQQLETQTDALEAAVAASSVTPPTT